MKSYCVKKQKQSGGFRCDLVNMHVDATFCSEICQGRYKRVLSGQMPGAKQLVRGAGKAAVRAAKAGFLQRSAEELKRIKTICEKCDRYSGGRCDLCGCFLKAKWRLASEKCPLEKWLPEKKKNIIHPKYNYKIFTRADGQPVNLIDMFKGQACFILSNGPSGKLKPPEYFKRPGIVTFGINNGGHYWRPDMVSLEDANIGANRFHHQIWGDPAIMKFTPLSARMKFYADSENKAIDEVRNCPNVIFHSGSRIHRTADTWFDANNVSWGERKASNSLLAVIHICYLLGFTRVYIWGCDYKMTEQQPYLFGETKSSGAVVTNNNNYAKTNKYLTAARPYIEAHGMTIYNCTPDSGLTAFDYMPIDEAIKKEEIEIKDDTQGLYHRGKPIHTQKYEIPKKPKQNYMFVAFYTRKTNYRLEAERLRDSLRSLRVDYDIQPIRIQGWQAANHYKPVFLQRMLEKHKKPIMYVDADAVVHTFPGFVNNYNSDIAVWWVGNQVRGGTIWLNYSPAAFEILTEWQAECRRQPKRWDQTNLKTVLDRGNWNVIKLPDSMCKIFDRQHNCKDPYVEHFQASRRLKS